MKPIKGDPMKQHVKVVNSKQGITTGRFIPVTPQVPPFPVGLMDEVVVCNMFDQYKLTDGRLTSLGMFVPNKYTTNTYGRNCRTDIWYKLEVVRNTAMGAFGKWFPTWIITNTNRVPKQFQTAALLLT